MLRLRERPCGSNRIEISRLARNI
ncbi:hypothetical protein YPPY66_1945, partial [Yersinia pestis PY-66]